MNDIIKQLGELALATRLKRLSDRLIQDVGSIYHEQGFEFDPRWFALMQVLQLEGTISVMDASAVLKITHPAVVQLADQLEKKKIISTSKDKADGRKRNLQLTDKGKKLLVSLAPLLKNIEEANRDFLRSSGYDVLSIIEKLETALEEKSMYDRVNEKIKKNELQNVEILEYQPKYKKDFKSLNYKWLKKYFKVEKVDEQILSHPEKEILQHGGQLFFAKENNLIVGTCAVKKISPRTFELTKMAVKENSQGKQIGKKLGLAVIAFAKKNDAKEIVLESSRKLESAMALYRKLGFAIESKITPSKYERETVKMKLSLK
jgi:DNA-binding MarR family transcriptional regulator/N-acetylglutamate synthase-like GNAT family acetyltransferase